MGTYYKGILGGFSGKVGTVVGAKWRGRDIMRSKPTPSDKPPTQAQIDQRIKFSVVANFLVPLRPIITEYFGEPYKDKSRYNLATAYHITEAATIVDGEGVIDYSKVLISKGDLPGLQTVSITAEANQQLLVNWTDNSDQPIASPTDSLCIVCFVPTHKWYEILIPGATRQDGTATVTLPTYFAGSDVEVWATFLNSSAGIGATSSYLGTFTVQ